MLEMSYRGFEPFYPFLQFSMYVLYFSLTGKFLGSSLWSTSCRRILCLSLFSALEGLMLQAFY